MTRHIGARTTLAMLALGAGCALIVSMAAAQGCEPIRFTVPVNLGGEGQAYQPQHEWQFTLAYRRLTSNEFFVGTSESLPPILNGRAPYFNIHTAIADVAYSINDRFRVRASVPFSKGSLSKIWADKVDHTQTATGLGDVSVMGEGWLLAPRTHTHGNIAFGLGVKAPTGTHNATSKFYTATSSVDFPAETTIQPGDGGWAVLLQAQGFRQVTDRTFAYAFGSYMVSPKAQSEIPQSPTVATKWSVPDVYSARLGGAFAVLPDHGLTMSLGARMDGIPIHDLVGGGDDATIKRTSFIMYADPGLSYTQSRGTLTLSVPYRLLVNRKKSVLEQSTNGLNGGGFAKYLVFLSYTHRL